MIRNQELATFLQVITTLGIGSILIVSLMYVTIPLLPLWVTEFHITATEAAWANSLYSMSYAISCLIFGVFSDRFQRKSIFTIGLLALTFSTVLVSFSTSLEWLFVSRTLQGLIAASVPVVALAYISDVLAARYRPIAISIISSGFLLAGILGQLYGQSIGDWLGWKAAFLILAAGYLLMLLFFVRLPKGQAPSKNQATTVLRQTMRVLMQPRLILSFLIMATFFLSFITMYTGLEAYVTKEFQLRNEDLRWIRIAGIPGILLSLLGGWFIRRFGAKTVLIVGLLTASGGIAIEGIANSIVLLVVASVVFVAGIAIANPSMIVIVGQLGAAARGSALAVNAFAAFVGASLGSLVAAQISSFSLLCSVLWLILLLAAVSAACFIPPVSVQQKTKNLAT